MRGKIIFFIVSTIVVFGIGFFIWSPDGLLKFDNQDDLANIAVEFHGMIFDVILFGIILTVYEYYSDKKKKKEDKEREKRLRIERYQEELDDYRGWSSEEAAFRVAGIVKRLLKEGVEDVELSNLHVGRMLMLGGRGKEMIIRALKDNKRFCSLEGAELQEANLKGVDLRYTNLEGTNLWKANLEGAKLWEASLKGADLRDTNLEGAKLRGASLKRADLLQVNLEGAELQETNLEGANLIRVNLQGAKAYQYQRAAFAAVMTKKQLNQIEWQENPDSYKEEEETTTPNQESQPPTHTELADTNEEQCQKKAKVCHNGCYLHLKQKRGTNT